MGLLEYDDATRRYRLGSRLFELGVRFYRQLDVARVARPVMERLVREYDETIVLTRYQDRRVICVDKIESSQPILFNIAAGTELPLYAGAASKVLLAHLRPSELHDLIARVPPARAGGRSVQQIETDLEEIRRRGYAFTSGEVVRDAWALSVPLFDAFARIAGGLSVSGPVHRLGTTAVETLARPLIAAASDISAALGAAGAAQRFDGAPRPSRSRAETARRRRGRAREPTSRRSS